MHAWKYPAHERRLAELAREAGFTQVSASHAVSPLLRLVPRGDTTVVDAYLSPILRRYVDQVAGELAGRAALFHAVERRAGRGAARFQGKDAILSGPAGGIVGAARTAAMAGLDRIIGFDMGGTSTDVALYAGEFERAFETAVAGVRMRAPMMAINTVAAGGGSILHFDGARLRVGPDSAGADPGPACYRRGGPLTVTDANVCVGKIQPRAFPGDLRPRRRPAARRRRGGGRNSPRWPSEIARGHRRAADAARRWPRASCASPSPTWRTRSSRSRCRRATTPRRFALQCFGGAGGQHACLVADELGMETVFIHPYRRRAVGLRHGPGRPDGDARAGGRGAARRRDAMPELEALADRLADEAGAALAAQGADPGAHRRARAACTCATPAPRPR